MRCARHDPRILSRGSQEQRKHIDHKHYCYRRNRISCIVSREMVAEMPRDKHAEDHNRDHDERNRQDQGLGVRSEYQPPTKEEFIVPFPSLVHPLRPRHGWRVVRVRSARPHPCGGPGTGGDHDGIDTRTREREI
uniref:Uncharacterized protein n=1 Tax=Arundo donax TaxID=35708 RepID=A0A0A9DC37_ARUDO